MLPKMSSTAPLQVARKRRPSVLTPSPTTNSSRKSQNLGGWHRLRVTAPSGLKPSNTQKRLGSAKGMLENLVHDLFLHSDDEFRELGGLSYSSWKGSSTQAGRVVVLKLKG